MSITFPGIVAMANLTGQTASIGSTTLYTVPANGAGFYQANVDIITTQAGAAGNVTGSIGWNNGLVSTGATTSSGVDLSMLGAETGNAGFFGLPFTFYAVANSTIVYFSTVTGGAGSTYSFRVRLEFLT